MTVVVTARFTPTEGSKEALVDALRATMGAVHEEPGCELYAIHDAEDGTVTMIEKWSARADLDAHAAGEAVRALQAATGPHLAGPVEVVVMTPLAASDRVKGAL